MRNLDLDGNGVFVLDDSMRHFRDGAIFVDQVAAQGVGIDAFRREGDRQCAGPIEMQTAWAKFNNR